MQSKKPLPLLLAAGLLLPLSSLADTHGSRTAETHRPTYPTAVIADYVLGCLIANGQTPEAMQKCACSMDYIAAEIPYEEYERIETLLRLQQIPGVGRNAVYKETPWSKSAVDRLREVQAESTLRCF